MMLFNNCANIEFKMYYKSSLVINRINAFLLLTFHTYSTENLLRTLAWSLFVNFIIDEF